LDWQRQKMLELEPDVPIEIIYLIIEILKISVREAEDFSNWIKSLDVNQLNLFVKLLQLNAHVLVDLKKKLLENEQINITTHIGYKRNRLGNNVYEPETEVDHSINNIELSKLVPNTKRQNNFSFQNNVSVDIMTDVQNDLIYDTYYTGQDDSINFQNNNDFLLFGDDYNQDTPFSDNLTNNEIGLHDKFQSSFDQSLELYHENETKGKNESDTLQVSSTTNEFLNVSPSPYIIHSYDAFFQLEIQRQPPPLAVYQRILKPNPIVMLIADGVFIEESHNLFVECSLLRGDNNQEVGHCLEGNRTVRIAVGLFAHFTKLKIMYTTQQMGTIFKLKFQLKRYIGNVMESIPGATIVSNIIETVSHRMIIQKKENTSSNSNRNVA